MNYLVIFERSVTGWGAYVPDLPGCVATGATRAEVERLIQEGIAFHIEGMIADGDTIPEPTTRVARMPVYA